MEINIEARLRKMRILWFALLMSIGSLFLVSRLAGGVAHEPGEAFSPLLVAAITFVGALPAIISFVVKGRILHQSVEKQKPFLVQQGLLIACALCEASALFGLLEHFAFGIREYYWLFLVAAISMALHFPRREQVLAAMPKIPIGGASS